MEADSFLTVTRGASTLDSGAVHPMIHNDQYPQRYYRHTKNINFTEISCLSSKIIKIQFPLNFRSRNTILGWDFEYFRNFLFFYEPLSMRNIFLLKILSCATLEVEY